MGNAIDNIDYVRKGRPNSKSRKAWVKRVLFYRKAERVELPNGQFIWNVKCHWCSTPLGRKDITLDHIVPICDGGETRIENLVLACFNCNQERSKSGNRR